MCRCASLQLVVLVVLLLSAPGQAESTERRWRLAFGAGPTFPWSADAFQAGLSTGFTLSIGAGYVLGAALEILGRLAYDHYPRDDEGVLIASPLPHHPARVLQMTGGDMSIRDLQLDLRLFPDGSNRGLVTRPFVLGALGLFSHRYEQVEIDYAWAGHTWSAVVPASRGTNPGLGVGAGMQFRLGERMTLVLEGRYQTILMSGGPLRSVPLSVQWTVLL